MSSGTLRKSLDRSLLIPWDSLGGTPQWRRETNKSSKTFTIVFSDKYIFELLQAALIGEIDKAKLPTIALSGVITTVRKTHEGKLIRASGLPWLRIVSLLRNDWSLAYKIPPEKWEELIAAAYDEAGFDEVTLTPRSGDHGRDVIAVRHGVGAVRILEFG